MEEAWNFNFYFFDWKNPQSTDLFDYRYWVYTPEITQYAMPWLKYELTKDITHFVNSYLQTSFHFFSSHHDDSLRNYYIDSFPDKVIEEKNMRTINWAANWHYNHHLFWWCGYDSSHNHKMWRVWIAHWNHAWITYEPLRSQIGASRHIGHLPRDYNLFLYIPSPSLNECITPFNIKEDSYFLTFKYKHFERDIYTIHYLSEQRLKHHDVAMGQYGVFQYVWNDPLVSQSWRGHKNNQVPGFHFLWYERFGSVEFIIKAIHTLWVGRGATPAIEAWQYSNKVFDSVYDYGTYFMKHRQPFPHWYVLENVVWKDPLFIQKGINDRYYPQ